MTTLVVFDMAGTTVNEENLVYRTLHATLEAANYKISWEEVLSTAAGMEKKRAIIAMLAAIGAEVLDREIEELFANFQQRLTANYLEYSFQPMPYALETFEYLHQIGVQVALNTGYDRKTALHILKRLGWEVGKEINLLVTASDVERNRPFPDMIHYAMAHLAVSDSKKVVKIGDSIVDIEEGKNAACGLSIGITTGAHTYTQLAQAQPDKVINSLEELWELI